MSLRSYQRLVLGMSLYSAMLALVMLWQVTR